MPPDQRRESILAAARPLLIKHGRAFTTRQLAEAVGIAEGTIFRVFATKEEIINELVSRTLDPTTVCQQIRQVDHDDPLVLVDTIMTLLEADGEQAMEVLTAARPHTCTTTKASDDAPGDAHPGHCRRGVHHARFGAIRQAIIEALGTQTTSLRTDPVTTAQLIMAAAMTIRSPFWDNDSTISTDELADLVCHGILKD